MIEIGLTDVKEPILACLNDPDDVKILSEVADEKIDEVFIGSWMTNIPTLLWIAPPTKMDVMILNEEACRYRSR